MLPSVLETDAHLYLYAESEVDSDEERNWLVDQPKELTTPAPFLYYAI